MTPPVELSILKALKVITLREKNSYVFYLLAVRDLPQGKSEKKPHKKEDFW